MSKLSKLLRSPAGQILAPLALGYAERQSKDVRRFAPLLDTGLQITQGASSSAPNALQNTIFATAAKGLLNAASANSKPQKTGVAMSNGNGNTPTTFTPGVKTSEFYMTIACVVALIASKFGFDMNPNEVGALIAALVALYTASRTIVKHAAVKQPDTVVVHAPVVTAPATSEPVIAVPPVPPLTAPVENVPVADDAAPIDTE